MEFSARHFPWIKLETHFNREGTGSQLDEGINQREKNRQKRFSFVISVSSFFIRFVWNNFNNSNGKYGIVIHVALPLNAQISSSFIPFTEALFSCYDFAGEIYRSICQHEKRICVEICLNFQWNFSSAFDWHNFQPSLNAHFYSLLFNCTLSIF